MKTRFPPHNILVAVDGSAPSWAALEAAKTLASALGSRLEVLYVEELLVAPQFEPGIRSLKRILRDKRAGIESRLAKAMAGMAQELWSFRVACGQPAAEILRQAAIRVAQLVVMGTHGRQGSERFLMGSTAEAVFHRARVPVLVLREGQAFKPGRLLVPCNLQLYADEAMLYALALARAFGAKVTALYVAAEHAWHVDAAVELRRHIETMFGTAAGAEIECLVRRGESREQIALEAQSGQYDLMVLSGHRRAQLSDLALGTTAERLLRRCRRLPLLAVAADPPARMKGLRAALAQAAA